MVAKPEIQRQNILTIRVRDHEQELIHAAAERERVTVSELMREVVLRRSRRIMESEGPICS